MQIEEQHMYKGHSKNMQLIEKEKYCNVFGFRVSVGLFCSTPAVAVGRAVPRKVAMEMLFTGHPITAQGIHIFFYNEILIHN